MYSSVKVLSYVAKLRLKRQSGLRSCPKTNVSDAGCDGRLNKNNALLRGGKYDSPSQVCFISYVCVLEILLSLDRSKINQVQRPILPV